MLKWQQYADWGIESRIGYIKYEYLVARIFKFEVFGAKKRFLTQYELTLDYLIIHFGVNNNGHIDLYTLFM